MSRVPRIEFNRHQPLAERSKMDGKMAATLRWSLLGVAVAVFGYAGWQAIRADVDPAVRDGLTGPLLLLACATTIAWQHRRLPMQSLVLACVIIATLSALITAIGTLSGIPFGPFDYSESAGPNLSRQMPLAIPVLWVTALLNSRGVARLILRPFRRRPAYGLWVIALTGLLMAVFAMVLDPFATVLREYWVWQPTKAGWTWHGAPWIAFVAWALCSILILAFATPSLINKKPVHQPPDFSPLLLWGLMLGFLSAQLFGGGLRIAGLFALCLLGVSVGLALLGGLLPSRRQERST